MCEATPITDQRLTSYSRCRATSLTVKVMVLLSCLALLISFALATVESPHRAAVVGPQPLRAFRNDTPREAYVSLLYGNFYVLPLRTLMRSLKDNCPDVARGQRERVVIATGSTSEKTMARLRSDGISVKYIPTVKTPYASEDHFEMRFRNVMTKLAIFNMTEYSRLVFIDADALVLRDMSEVWRCGRFCAVFINPCHFNSGMMMVTPSTETFNDMLSKLHVLPSYDGGDQGFLNSYYPQMLTAPMFDPSPTGLDTSKLDFVRLPFPFHMDHSAFYPRLRWDHSRARCGGDAREEEWLGPPFSKPWLWYTYWSLDQSWVWNQYRSKLEDPFPEGSFTSWTSVVLVGLSYSLFVPLIWAKRRLRHPIALALTSLLPSSISFSRRLSLLIIILCGFSCWTISMAVSAVLIPPLLPPYIAFFTFTHIRATLTLWYLVFVLGSIASRAETGISGIPKMRVQSSSLTTRVSTLPRIVRECAAWAIVDSCFAVLYNYAMWVTEFDSLVTRMAFIFRGFLIHFVLTFVMLARVGCLWLSWTSKKDSKGR